MSGRVPPCGLVSVCVALATVPALFCISSGVGVTWFDGATLHVWSAGWSCGVVQAVEGCMHAHMCAPPTAPIASTLLPQHCMPRASIHLSPT